MLVMTALRAMHVRRRLSRWSELSWEDDAAAFMLLGQMLCDFGMVGSNIPDHAI